MIETKAIGKYIRVSPQKARLVVDLIRGKMVSDALTILDFNTKAVARPIKKVLSSAIANAENNNNLDVDRLYVKKAFVDAGPTMKRMHTRAQGRGVTILKRTSHITVIVDEKGEKQSKAARSAKPAKGKTAAKSTGAKPKAAKKEAK